MRHLSSVEKKSHVIFQILSSYIYAVSVPIFLVSQCCLVQWWLIAIVSLTYVTHRISSVFDDSLAVCPVFGKLYE